MSETDWYAIIDQVKPWNSIRDYQREIAKKLDLNATKPIGDASGPTNSKHAATAKPEATTAKIVAIVELDLTAIAAEAARMFEAIPQVVREAKPVRVHCYGLPRKYPMMWMAMPQSNSLMFEFKEVRSLPSNKSWKD